MYYSNIPANGSAVQAIPVAADKPGVYVQAPNPYPPGYQAAAAAAAHHQLPIGLTPQHHHPTAQAYAMVANPYGSMAPTGYASYSAVQRLPQTSNAHPFLATGQYPSSLGYASVNPRTLPVTAYQAAPMQTGAPLYAAGYPGLPPGAVTAHQAPSRSYNVAGTVPGYPQGYTIATEIPYGAAAFGPPY